MGNLRVLLTVPTPTHTCNPQVMSHRLDRYRLTHGLLLCHPPIAPASKKTCDCGLLQVQELIRMTTWHVIIIVGAGVKIHPASSGSWWCCCQMIHHPVSSGSQAWVLSPEWASLSLSPLSLMFPAHHVIGPPVIHPTSSCS
jgi:hypothetical protein